MWRRIVQIVSSILSLGGLVGLITLPDDAPLWPKRFGPLLSAMTKDDLIIALFALSAAGFAWTIFGPQIAEWVRRRRAAPMRVEFEYDSTKWFEPSPYRLAITLGVPADDGEGVKLDGAISRHMFGFAVRNRTHTTARGVRAALIRTGGSAFMTQTMQAPLWRKERGEAPVNIQPGFAETFMLFEYIDSEWGGMFGGMEQIPATELEFWRQFSSENWVSATVPQGLSAPNLNGGYPIGLPPKGKNLVLDVAIYADDMPPTYARFILDRDKHVVPRLAAQGLNLPPETSTGSRWLSNIAQKIRLRTRPG